MRSRDLAKASEAITWVSSAYPGRLFSVSDLLFHSLCPEPFFSHHQPTWPKKKEKKKKQTKELRAKAREPYRGPRIDWCSGPD